MQLVPIVLEKPCTTSLGSSLLTLLIATPSLVPYVVRIPHFSLASIPTYSVEREDDHLQTITGRAYCRCVVFLFGIVAVFPLDV